MLSLLDEPTSSCSGPCPLCLHLRGPSASRIRRLPRSNQARRRLDDDDAEGGWLRSRQALPAGQVHQPIDRRHYPRRGGRAPRQVSHGALLQGSPWSRQQRPRSGGVRPDGQAQPVLDLQERDLAPDRHRARRRKVPRPRCARDRSSAGEVRRPAHARQRADHHPRPAHNVVRPRLERTPATLHRPDEHCVADDSCA